MCSNILQSENAQIIRTSFNIGENMASHLCILCLFTCMYITVIAEPKAECSWMRIQGTNYLNLQNTVTDSKDPGQ